MAGFNGMTLTKKGIALLSKIQQGGSITFTRMAAGDGQLTSGQDDKQLTGLVHYLRDIPVGKVERVSEDTTVIRGVLTNAGLTQGFVIREIGMFAVDPDEGEILHSYTNAGDEPDYIPVPGKVTAEEFIEVYTVVGQAETVNMTIDPSIVFLTQVDLNNHENETDPHKKWLRVGTRVTDCADVWVSSPGETTPVPTIRPLAFETLKRQILGGDGSDITTLRSNDATLFRAIQEYALEQEAKSLAPNGYSLVFAENFEDCDEVDVFSTTVQSVAGDDTILVSSVKGLLTGSYYTISDGVNQELIQIRSIIKNDTDRRVIATEKLKYTYQSGKTSMYRSTAQIVTSNGEALGAGDQRAKMWEPNITFSGVSGNVPQTAILDTSLSNAALTVTGDGAFTADGYFTLK